MKIIEVSTRKTRQEFLDIARIIYKDDKNWACPLDREINEIFDPTQNSCFKNGEATRWILKDAEGKVIGRIAAFINKNKAYNFDQPTGGCGFFECIDDKNAAFLLFDTAKSWLKERGMEAMDGPINFGENDTHWGLLVDGFMPQGIGMPYHKPYYQKLFESYGFKLYFKQFSHHLDLRKPFPERFWKIAAWIAQKPGFHFEHLQFKNLEKYVNDIITIFNEAWKFHESYVPIHAEEIIETARKNKTIIDEEFIWFAYNNNKPIAFLMMLPDANQILTKLNGKLGLWNTLKFLYYLKRKTITRTRISIMGVVPKFQRFGVESAIFWHLDKIMQKKPHYTEVELSWVGDFNPKMKSIYESVGGVHMKTHHTYRYLFDPSATFKRAPIIPSETKESDKKQKKVSASSK